MKSLLLQNKYYYGTILFFIIAEGILVCLTSKVNVTLWINAHWYAILDKIVLTIDTAGTGFFNTGVILVLWIWKKWRIALKATVCFTLVMIITQFMKYIVFPGIPRPVLYFEPGTLRLIEGIKQLTTESFPSGHTSASFALSTFFALYLSCKPWHWLLALLAFAVSYGRIYLSQHFITDVYASMWIGVVFTTLIYHYYPARWLGKSKNTLK